MNTKKILLLTGLLITHISFVIASLDDITGQWNGVLSVPGVNLRIVFHIQKTETGYAATMDSPDQNAAGIPVTTTTFDGSKLVLELPGIVYEGAFKTDSIAGTFKQGGMALPLVMKRTQAETKPLVRPQTPKPPFPYRSEEVTFPNKSAGITLAGTLTLPEKGNNFTAVILITGSGPHNRDEEILGHKPFLVIADYLTRNGIAVLRYDDRGMAKSTGIFATSTTADFATDTESAIEFLKTRKEVNPRKIGLIGHSEGGIIAPMVAARSKDISFIVLLAGSGVRGDSLLLLQNELLARAAGMPEDKIARGRKLNTIIYNKIVSAKENVSIQEITALFAQIKNDLAEFKPEGMADDDFIRMNVAATANPWTQFFLRYDPAPALEKVKCPVLAVNGSKDLQVPANVNLAAINTALKKGGNKAVTVKEYPNLNHLFQECTTGLSTEYETIEQTFSPTVLKDLTKWIITILK